MGKSIDMGGSTSGNYLSLNGGSIDGSITSISFIKRDGTSDEFLMADGTVKTDVVLSDSTVTKIVVWTQEQYDEAVSGGTIDNTTIYFIKQL